MKLLRRLLELTLVPMATLVIVAFPSGSVRADEIPAAAVAGDPTREKDLSMIRELLSKPEATVKLADAGLTREEVERRIEAMTTAEVHYVAERMREEVKSGGDCWGVVIAILVIALLVILIIVLLDKSVEVKDKKAHIETGTKPEGVALARGAVLG